MTETKRLLATLKRLLKSRGYTYRKIASALYLSEPTVKRLFSNGNISLERLTQLAALVDMSILELANEAASDEPRITRLSLHQEKELAAELRLLLVAVCTLNHWRMPDIISAYQISETECLQYLLRLDKLRLIDLLPGNRIRLNIARDFDWLPEGPIRQLFRQQALDDFVDDAFQAPDESFFFLNGMLSQTATTQFQTKLRRLKQDFADLHQESLSVPLAQRQGTALLCAMRTWEPQVFSSLRRGRNDKHS
ncbi:helix-turn-helix domain-containing protein [Undibacterium sp. Di27W]|uniref:helix-turn-helix domain-containing protein n=1 Tax=Undibacterium sp. Di27W TaxID=3413036 RepID=UPI003BEF4F56